MTDSGFAVVTGASSGIGYELARRAIEDGYTLLICSNEPEIETAADNLRHLGGTVETLDADLATEHGVEALWRKIRERDIDLLFANAGRALGHAFHEQDWHDIKQLTDLNIKQTTSLLHKVGGKMRSRGSGRILVTGSIGGFVPGPFNAVYNGTKAYLDSLCYALHEEWKEIGISITCLMPGPSETLIFERADMSDTPIGKSDNKDDAAMVARAGYEAMMKGEAGVVPGVTSKVLAMMSGLVPDGVLAAIHRKGAEPPAR